MLFYLVHQHMYYTVDLHNNTQTQFQTMRLHIKYKLLNMLKCVLLAEKACSR